MIIKINLKFRLIKTVNRVFTRALINYINILQSSVYFIIMKRNED